MVNNLKEAKKLLEKYKSITLEELKEKYKKEYVYITGRHVLNAITGFSSTKDCILCQKVYSMCCNCIYSFRMDNGQMKGPCVDIIYQEMSEALSAEKLFNAIQKRISYLTHIIEWYENSN